MYKDIEMVINSGNWQTVEIVYSYIQLYTVMQKDYITKNIIPSPSPLCLVVFLSPAPHPPPEPLPSLSLNSSRWEDVPSGEAAICYMSVVFVSVFPR